VNGEIIEQLRNLLRDLWRYRWRVLALAWALAVVGWAYVAAMPDQYQAKARVYVDTDSVLRPLLKGLAVQGNVRSEVQLMTRTLLSRPNLEKVARMTDLDLRARDEEEMDRLLDALASKVGIARERRTRGLFTLSYTDPDPEVAKRVVQALITVFTESALGETRRDASEAQRFLDEQIREYEARLVEAEQRLAEFKKKHVGMMPSEGRDYYESLQAALGELEQAKLQLREAERRRDEIQRQLEDAEAGEEDELLAVPPPGVAGSPTPAIDARIQNLEARLDELLLRYTERHPDVVAIRRTIEDLKRQREEILAAQAESPAPALLGGAEAENPLVAQLRLALGEAEATVASLQARVEAFQAKAEKLRRMVDIIPEVEARLKQLNRDYGVIKARYEELLARREAARLAERADRSTSTVKFRVVDPPYVPPEPTGPDRPLLSSVAFGASLAAGLALAFLLAQLHPVYYSRRQLLEDTGLPVLGGVSMVWSGGALARRRLGLAGFLLAALALAAAYGAVMAWQLGMVPPELEKRLPLSEAVEGLRALFPGGLP